MKSPHMHEMEGLAYDTGFEDGAAVAFGLMGMAYAVRRMTGIEDSPHTPCSYCGARVEHFGVGCPVCNMFRKWDGWPETPDRNADR